MQQGFEDVCAERCIAASLPEKVHPSWRVNIACKPSYPMNLEVLIWKRNRGGGGSRGMNMFIQRAQPLNPGPPHAVSGWASASVTKGGEFTGPPTLPSLRALAQTSLSLLFVSRQGYPLTLSRPSLLASDKRSGAS